MWWYWRSWSSRYATASTPPRGCSFEDFIWRCQGFEYSQFPCIYPVYTLLFLTDEPITCKWYVMLGDHGNSQLDPFGAHVTLWRRPALWIKTLPWGCFCFFCEICWQFQSVHFIKKKYPLDANIKTCASNIIPILIPPWVLQEMREAMRMCDLEVVSDSDSLVRIEMLTMILCFSTDSSWSFSLSVTKIA